MQANVVYEDKTLSNEIISHLIMGRYWIRVVIIWVLHQASCSAWNLFLFITTMNVQKIEFICATNC